MEARSGRGGLSCTPNPKLVTFAPPEPRAGHCAGPHLPLLGSPPGNTVGGSSAGSLCFFTGLVPRGAPLYKPSLQGTEALARGEGCPGARAPC